MRGSVLLSTCQRIDGIWNKTEIDLNQYISYEGSLKWDPSGGFIKSCKETRLSSSIFTRHIEMNADCEKEGDWVTDYIDLDEHIANIDGVLKYE